MDDARPFPFICPRCQAPLVSTGPDALTCPEDGQVYPRLDGIWRLLPPERLAAYSQFVHEYETVRRAEGRRLPDAACYRALPDLDGCAGIPAQMAADWRIRAAGFQALLAQVVRPLEAAAPPGRRPLRILDLGAGNGWLSNRLAACGHLLAAVDLMTNDFDGLGCWRCYETSFTPVQAEFDHLPFARGSADLAIFNASLHYSVDYTKTLAEAARTLAPGGRLVLLDSPFYPTPASGEQMVRERQAGFTRRFGFPSNALPSQNYLTYPGLSALAERLGLQLRLQTPSYPLAWRLRPLLAALLGRRPPARFHLVTLILSLAR